MANVHNKDLRNLVLTRKEGERVMVGHDLIVEIIEVGPGRKVRLLFQAPPEVPIYREEIYENMYPEETGNDRAP